LAWIQDATTINNYDVFLNGNQLTQNADVMLGPFLALVNGNNVLVWLDTQDRIWAETVPQ
jgi:hypothetical protein